MTESLIVEERGRTIAFTFDDMIRYHGPHSPAGVAIAFKAMQRAFAVALPRRAPAAPIVLVRTPFRGPGARDGFEAVTRAVSDGRYIVDRSLVRSDRGRLLEDFVFVLAVRRRGPRPCCCATASSPTSSSTWPAPRTAPTTQEDDSTS